ncbi:glycoside hydrolase family 16 protein [Xylona heveae TC161]|uniref:Glycoside hydrolase family 16 protein n=1 Tax=Xylona heveae (strain CBS 132557 / TC161) TaxID=1328760 RepID=A0A165A522_XYLHT|nr:glycoside hydrolase family 16 protein [Xylona heveae TC161]KZF19960.1 glycoside hydrolase family 16 protein [Xylona heveae TC161]
MSSLESPSARDPPHIRLNSGNEDPLMNEPAESPVGGPARQDSARSLIPQRPPSVPSITASLPGSNGLYTSPGVAESAERLLPPKRSRTHRFRDDDSPARSPDPSGYSSRRTSWSSESGSRDSRMGPFASPFDDSRAPSRAGSDDDNVNTQTVSEKYNILPSAGLLLFPEDVEKDDWLHNPDPNEKEPRECDLFSKRGFVNVGGLLLITLGLLALFIAYPILTFVQKINYSNHTCAADPDCLDADSIPLFKNIRQGLIDPTTPDSAKTRTSVNGKTMNLVFSDEFNVDGRTFYSDDDPYLQAVDLWYGVTQDMEWYDPDAVTTKDGVLELRFDAYQSHGLNYRSGMVQSWNQMCFQGGYMEASISLPGRGDTIGFWPGFWAMGNLGRPGHASTTDGLWPYSYSDVCDAGITKNQSAPDGINLLPGMRLPACTCSGEDHPSPGKSRAAPEIDALEASVTFLGPGNQNGIGSASQSAQVAPFDIWYQPDYDFVELYDPSISMMNAYRGGVYQQALSGVTNLNNDWYDGKAYQTFGFEYTPGGPPDGKITWYVGEQKTWMLDARAIGPNGNIGQRWIPIEPMALVMNFGLSQSFAMLNLTGLAPLMPAKMRFDYVRIYQEEGSESVTCDPPGYETTEYIENHKDSYYNPNVTSWDQTSHSWPKNSFVNGC